MFNYIPKITILLLSIYIFFNVNIIVVQIPLQEVILKELYYVIVNFQVLIQCNMKRKKK